MSAHVRVHRVHILAHLAIDFPGRGQPIILAAALRFPTCLPQLVGAPPYPIVTTFYRCILHRPLSSNAFREVTPPV